MLHILGKLPDKAILACSGGLDSMVALDFLHRGGKNITIAYFNHGTEYGQSMEGWFTGWPIAAKWSPFRQLPLVVGYLQEEKSADQSQEEFWREQRYKFLTDLSDRLGQVVITAHQLDDQVEQYIFSMLNGKERLIPYESWDGRVIRPFLLNKRDAFTKWAIRQRPPVPWLEDPSNDDVTYMRNLIRKELVPKALEVNPGLYKVVKKKTAKEYLLKNDSGVKFDFLQS